jgi:type I restriction enzyme S subunit
MTIVRLGDVCQQARESVKPGARSDLRYIGLESIESGSGLFAEGELSKTPEAPLANSFRFGPEHVLYGKLRPYLNKVVAPGFEGKCSTEIIPLLPSSDIDRTYLAYFLRSQHVVDLISARTAGARMPRADMDFIFSLSIPLPPLPEQGRIVDLLSRAEGIVRLRRNAEKKAAELIPALFLDMFGDPATNPKGWPVKLLGDLAANAKYAIKAGPFGSALKKAMYVPTGYKIYGQEQVIRDDLAYGDYYIDEAKYRELEGCKIQSHDLLISLVGTFGKISVVPETFQPGIINPRLMKISLDRSQVLPRFLKALLTGEAMRGRIEDRSHGGTMSIVNVGIMKSLEICVPPLALQNRFCESADAMLSIQTQQSAATAKAQDAFDALLAGCFGQPATV